MENKLLKITSVLLVVTALLFCTVRVIDVKADSGWDSSYDSGSSRNSGSSWNSGSRRNSGSSRDYDIGRDGHSGSSRPLTKKEKIDIIIIWTLIIGFFILLYFIARIIDKKIIPPIKSKILRRDIEKNKKLSFRQTKSPITYLTEIEARKIISDFDKEKFIKKAYNIFYNIQIGWMEFDYDKLKKLLTDELYNMYVMDLEVLKSKHQKNIMRGFELVITNLIDLKKENSKYIAKVLIEVKFIDYIEDSITHKVLRGSDTDKLCNTYILTFESTKESKQTDICPQCGASVEGNSIGICEYCKSKLVNETYDWVLSKKEIISQR